MVKKLALCGLIVLGFAVLFDVVGVVAATVLDVLPLFGKSVAVFYALWLVLGAFCGFLSYNFAGSRICGAGEGDWSTRPEARSAGLTVLASAVVVFTALAVAARLLLWTGNRADDFYVPDSLPLSIVFFASMLSAMVVAQKSFLTAPAKPPDGA